MDEEAQRSQTQTAPTGAKMALVLIWIFSLGLASFISYSVGKNSILNISPTPTVSAPQVLGTTPTPTQAVQKSVQSSSPPVDTNTICKKSGLSQKWEYLTPYKIKEGDSLISIAEEKLGDSSRISEIVRLNETSQLVIGAVLYLPPQSVPKSSGNLKQVNGMLLSKSNAAWRISFGGGEEGSGMAIPAYWFLNIENKESFKTGDCLSILVDDGYKVYEVRRQ